jgi:nitrogen regulatory protein P-II 1
MKKIEVVIRSEKVGSVRSALEKSGYPGLMITQLFGHGKQKGAVQNWHGCEYKVELLPKSRIEIVVKDQDLERITEAIINSAHTGSIGDGKIFISSVDNAIRIRTHEEGEKALD